MDTGNIYCPRGISSKDQSIGKREEKSKRHNRRNFLKLFEEQMNNTANNRRSAAMPIKLGEITLYDIMELSKKLNVTPTTLRSYMKKGRLKGQKVGGRWMISEEGLKDFFAPKESKK